MTLYTTSHTDWSITYASRLKACGIASIVGAASAILGNAWLFVVDPAVPSDRLSWPLTPHAYVFMQVFFALTQLLLGCALLGLALSDAVDRGRRAMTFRILAVAGMALTVPGELVLILVRNDRADASAVSSLSGVFGMGVLLADIGLIGQGILALRQRTWPRTWASLPLVLGLFQLFVVTPVSITFGFTGIASNVTIAVADALTALLGICLIREASRRIDARPLA
ncbi:MAG: hypothetical protein QM747_17120 [Nocardioides sp.]